MKYLNLHYIAILIIAGILWLALGNTKSDVVSFYGFAETNETEINFNHSVVVDEILIAPGEYVEEGQILMKVARIKSKDFLQNQKFEIDELKAEEKIWKTNKEQDLRVLMSDQGIKMENINNQIQALEEELKYKKEIVSALNTIKTEEVNYKPLLQKIEALKTEKELLKTSFGIEQEALRTEISMGNNPYRERRNLLLAEIEFENNTKVISKDIVAPSNGLIGNVHCKEAEHIPAFRTLISFYEPHPSLIKGFVHEDLSLQVNIGDTFMVSSLKENTPSYEAKVAGLGSRIVEIPERLRKLPDIKTYGREITLSIDPQNTFLQKEKVGLELKVGSDVQPSKTNILVKNK